MKAKNRSWRRLCATGGAVSLFGATLMLATLATRTSEAGIIKFLRCGQAFEAQEPTADVGGTWYWLRSPEEEKRVVIGLYTRYCVRCHGVDGRGIWDIPGVPDFTNSRWQASRSDPQLVRAIVEGRGACMPPFRGTLTLEEAWAMGRYLRTFLPGTEVSRPNLTQPEKLPPPKR